MGAGASVGLQSAPDYIGEQLCQVLVGQQYYDAGLFKKMQNEEGMILKSDLLKITSQSDCYFLCDSDGKEGAQCFTDQLRLIEHMLVAKNLICWLDESRMQSNPHYRISLQADDSETAADAADEAMQRLKDPTRSSSTAPRSLPTDKKTPTTLSAETEAAINHAQCILVCINQPFVQKVSQKSNSQSGASAAGNRCRAEFNYACIHKTGVKMIPVILQSGCAHITEWTDALGIPPIDMSGPDVFTEVNCVNILYVLFMII